jgi:nitrile hydratase subunit beta
MGGIADMGGTSGWGSVSAPTADEPVFKETWESRAFAMTLLTMGRISGRNLDAFRHALGRLSREDYLDDGYYGRWLNAAELMLTDSAILAPGAVDARVRANRGEQVDEPPAPAQDAKPDYKPTAAGSLRTVDTAPRFAVGDRVRVKDEDRPGHTQRVGYLRGRTGVVAIVQPAALLPDTHAVFQGENPQHVYAVAFDSHEVWGADADPFTITADLFDSYLEAAP